MARVESESHSRRGRPAMLTIDRITICALDMGLDKLSMHRVAKKLGVSTTALYRHVKDKEELIALCTDRVSRGVKLPDTDNWKQYLGELSHAYRNAALEIPGSVEFVRYVGMQTPYALMVFDHALGVMKDAGFEGEAAFMAVAGVVSHATDMVLHQELAERRQAESEDVDLKSLSNVPNVIWAMQGGTGFDHQRNFETGLQIIIAGVDSVFKKRS